MVQGKRASMIDTFAPPVQLLAKLGSIIVHIEEGLGDDWHHFDLTATRSLLADREVQEWLESMRAKALVPVKRK